MKRNRRDFLKLSGLTGVGITASTHLSSMVLNSNQDQDTRKKHFNMCGYAAPKLDTVRIGFIGLGNRGPAAVSRMNHIEGTEIKGLSDIRPEKANAVKKSLENTAHKPDIYT
ncbi:MAG: twin-arginine translocation signal domain-containing protein, partial [Saprospiraceae bacterium]|nr:twin-arginine translocation signal domain-containing protein [Saprospiraceae bacterium]